MQTLIKICNLLQTKSTLSNCNQGLYRALSIAKATATALSLFLGATKLAASI